jgi:hypothetical protein
MSPGKMSVTHTRTARALWLPNNTLRRIKAYGTLDRKNEVRGVCHGMTAKDVAPGSAVPEALSATVISARVLSPRVAFHTP